MPALAAGPLALSTIAPPGTCNSSLLSAARSRNVRPRLSISSLSAAPVRAPFSSGNPPTVTLRVSVLRLPHLHLDFLARLGTRHDQRKVRRALDRLAVVLDDHITGYNARALGRSALLHRCHQCTFWPAHPGGRCQLLSHLLDLQLWQGRNLQDNIVRPQLFKRARARLTP